MDTPISSSLFTEDNFAALARIVNLDPNFEGSTSSESLARFLGPNGQLELDALMVKVFEYFRDGDINKSSLYFDLIVNKPLLLELFVESMTAQITNAEAAAIKSEKKNVPSAGDGASAATAGDGVSAATDVTDAIPFYLRQVETPSIKESGGKNGLAWSKDDFPIRHADKPIDRSKLDSVKLLLNFSKVYLKQKFNTSSSKTFEDITRGPSETLPAFLYRKYYLFRLEMATAFSAHEKTIFDGLTTTWATDAEFARQRFFGLNPMMVKKCSKVGIPEWAKAHLSACQEDRLFVIDYVKVLDDLKMTEIKRCNPFKGAHLVPPVLFLESKGSLETPTFLPILIKIGEEVFKPNVENPLDPVWFGAKLRFLEFDGQYHEIISHLAETHLASETFFVAASVALGKRHPIYVLLETHFTGVTAINALARTQLLNDFIGKSLSLGVEGTFDILKHKAGYLQRTDIKKLYLPQWLEDSGMKDLPWYPVAKYGKKFWDSINVLCMSILKEFYPDPLQFDIELLSFLSELKIGGFCVSDITTREQLAELLTYIIWLSSFQHSLINFFQRLYYTFPPNSPLVLAPGQLTTDQQIISALPGYDDSIKASQMVTLLSTPIDKTILEICPLRQYEGWSARVFRMFKDFKTALETIAAEMPKSPPDYCYFVLLPEFVPESISI